MLDRLVQRLTKRQEACRPDVEAEPGASGPSSDIAIDERVGPRDVLPAVSELVTHDPWISFDKVTLDRRVEEYIAQDPYPIPRTCDREGYHGDRHYDYWLSGLRDYLWIMQVLDDYGSTLDQPLAIFDFGCASGRVLRHFLCHEPDVEVWGADVNIKHIDWILQFLGSVPRVFQNSVVPSLPIEDCSISLTYALSVFTHIDCLELAWLCELRRVLRPGGIAYVTVHTDRTWRDLGPHHKLYYDLLQREEFGLSPESFKEPMCSDRLVFKWPGRAVNNSTVFHSTEYIVSAWSRFFDVIDVRRGPDYPDIVVLKKPA